jgi:glucose 1-dehydrogenase
MNLRLKGQVAIITGSSTGIGRACAIALAKEGVAVTINYHTSDEMAITAVKEITDAGGKAIMVKADVTIQADVERLVQETVAAFGHLDIMVSNAGIEINAPFLDMEADTWHKVLDVGLHGQFYAIQAAARQFAKQGLTDRSRSMGRIISMSSVHDRIPWVGHTNYAASKGGVKLLMESVAMELAPQKIRVNSISPGAIATDINRAAWEKKEDLDDLLEKIPYNRIGQTEDVANLCLFLCSDVSDYMTGATVYIDGGMTLYPSFMNGG